MYALLSKLIISGKLKFAEGKIIGFNEPLALIPMTSIKQMTDDAIRRGIQDITDLYYYGWVYGFSVTKQLIKSFHLKKFEERYKVAMDIIGVVGFGDYKTIKFQRGVMAEFQVLGNPFALKYYPHKEFVCHYSRGMEAGGGTLVHETLMNNIEFDCAAVNGGHCLHRNLNEEKMDEVDKKLVSKQIDLNYVKKRQKETIEDFGYKPADFGL